MGYSTQQSYNPTMGNGTNPTMGYGGLNATQPSQQFTTQPYQVSPPSVDTSYGGNGMSSNPADYGMAGNMPVYMGPYVPPSGSQPPQMFSPQPYPAPGNTGFFTPGGGFSPGTQPYMPPAPTPTSSAPFGGPQRPTSYPAASSGAGIGSFSGGLSAPGSPGAALAAISGAMPAQSSVPTNISGVPNWMGVRLTPDGRLTF